MSKIRLRLKCSKIALDGAWHPQEKSNVNLNTAIIVLLEMLFCFVDAIMTNQKVAVRFMEDILDGLAETQHGCVQIDI
jgi:hypothetical protein